MTTMVRASGLRGYVALMQALGGGAERLLKRHDIPRAALDNDDALISLSAVSHLLEASAAETGCPDFGLRLSHYQDIGVLGALGIAIQNAPTVRQAIGYSCRYMSAHSAGLVVTVQEDSQWTKGAVDVHLEVRLPRQPAKRQAIDLCLGDMHRFIRMLAADQYRLHAVTLPHRPEAPIAAYEQFFGSKVLTEQSHATLCLGKDTLRADLRGANLALRQISEEYIARTFGKSLVATHSSRVRQALRLALSTAQCSKEDIAGLLAVHPRTLQRYLTLEDTSFEMIREEVRKETAMQYLSETRIPLGQLAALLGFPEQSALTRACRRWFGVPPLILRKQLMLTRQGDQPASRSHS